MKKRITGATFDASAKTITHADFSDLTLAGIQMIINVTDQIIIYNFADTAKGGTLVGDVLTLEYDTISMEDTDSLMILVDDAVTTQTVSGTVAVTNAGITSIDGKITACNTGAVAGTVTANLSATDNAVLDTIDAVLDTINTKLVTGTVIGDVNLGATDNAVLDTIAAKDFATQTTLALIKAKTDNIPALGQALAAASVPVILPSATITTLTPPAAITGFATETTLGTVHGHVDSIDTKITACNTGAVVLAAGTAGIGKLTANSGVDIGDVDVLSLPAIPAGTNAIGKLLPSDVDVTAHTNYARKYYTNAGAVTDGIIWSPAAGKRWHVVTMYIQISAASTVTLEDDKAGGDDPIWKGELAANSGVVLSFTEKYPMASGEDAADLTITTTAGNVYVTCVGYEI